MDEETAIRRDIEAVTSWHDVDTAMGVLRLIEAEQHVVHAEEDQRIQAIQERKARRLEPLEARKTRIEREVRAFVVANREQLVGRKSWPGTHGRVGFRRGPARVEFAHSEEYTLRAVRARARPDLLHVRETLDKAALLELPVAELGLLGVRVVGGGDDFYYRLKADPVVTYPDDDGGE